MAEERFTENVQNQNVESSAQWRGPPGSPKAAAAQELVNLRPCLHRSSFCVCRRAVLLVLLMAALEARLNRQSGQTKVAAPTTRIQTKADIQGVYFLRHSLQDPDTQC